MNINYWLDIAIETNRRFRFIFVREAYNEKQKYVQIYTLYRAVSTPYINAVDTMTRNKS